MFAEFFLPPDGWVLGRDHKKGTGVWQFDSREEVTGSRDYVVVLEDVFQVRLERDGEAFSDFFRGWEVGQIMNLLHTEFSSGKVRIDR